MIYQQQTGPDTWEIAGLLVGVLGLIPFVLYLVERKRSADDRRQRREAERALLERVKQDRRKLREGKGQRYFGLNSSLPKDLTPSLGKEWAESRAQARITTLVSGKGGVGKSVLSLALTEQYSMEDKVLLVDFDMHHRGLTSLLLPKLQQQSDESCDVFGELKRFRSKCLPAVGEPKGKYGRYDLNKLTPREFEEVCESFVYERVADAKAVRKLAALPLPQNPVYSALNRKTIGACQCYLLPNLRHEEGFLLTDVSRMDISEIFLFLRCLAEWAHTSLGVTRMVIDSGGAHDAFAVGAVLSASHLTVVTTSEPGAIEGTAEIVVFSRKLVDDKVFMPESDVLVLNQYRIESDECISELCELFQSLVQQHVRSAGQLTPVRVRNSERVRSLMQDYSFPSMYKCEDLWNLVGAMCDRKATHPMQAEPGADSPPSADSEGPANPAVPSGDDGHSGTTSKLDEIEVIPKEKRPKEPHRAADNEPKGGGPFADWIGGRDKT